MNVLSYKIRKNEKQEEKKKKASQELTVCKAGVCKPNDHKNNHDNEVKINRKQKLEKKKKREQKSKSKLNLAGKQHVKGRRKTITKKNCKSRNRLCFRHADER